jgi:hypothetical protein
MQTTVNNWSIEAQPAAAVWAMDVSTSGLSGGAFALFDSVENDEGRWVANEMPKDGS